MNKEKSCGCIILKDDKVLLIGSKDDDGKLFWSFPKGHQEEGGRILGQRFGRLRKRLI